MQVVTIEDYLRSCEDEICREVEPDNEFQLKGKILGFLTDLEKARKRLLQIVEDGGVADSRADRFNSRDYDCFDIDVDR